MTSKSVTLERSTAKQRRSIAAPRDPAQVSFTVRPARIGWRARKFHGDSPVRWKGYGNFTKWFLFRGSAEHALDERIAGLAKDGYRVTLIVDEAGIVAK